MPVTLAPNALTTPEAVYEEMGLDFPGGGASDRVLRLINAVSQRIENHLHRALGRKVFTTEDPEQLAGSGGPWIFLSRYPIEAVEEVLVDGSEFEFGRSDEYDLKGMLQSSGWPRRTARDGLTGDPAGSRAFNITIAYTGGYKLPNATGDGTPLPADIESICLAECVMAYRAPRHFISEETTAGGWKRKYTGSGDTTRPALMRESIDGLIAYKRKHFGNP